MAAKRRNMLNSAQTGNSPALQRWVTIQKHKSSPVRDGRGVVPAGLGGLIGPGYPAINGWAIFISLSSGPFIGKLMCAVLGLLRLVAANHF
jgi:hypothetical protein